MSTDLAPDVPMDAPDPSGEDTTQWSGLDEDMAELVTNKGWKSPADALRSYMEVEKDRGRILSERDRAFEALQTAEEYNPTPPATQPGGMDLASIGAALEHAVNNGEMDYGQGIRAIIDHVVPQLIEQKVQERITPLQNEQTSQKMQASAQSLLKMFDEAGIAEADRKAIAQEAIKLARPGTFYDQSAEGMEAATAIAFMNKYLGEAKAKQIRERSATIDQGSRSTAETNASASEEYRKLMMNYGQ